MQDQVGIGMTGPERLMLAELRRDGVDFVAKPRVPVVIHGRRRRLTPDFLVPMERLVIEVNGCYVHGCRECGAGQGSERRRERDRARLDAFTRAGYDVEVVWEHELLERVRTT